MFQSPLKTVSEKIKPVESKSSVSSLKFERPSDFKKFINFIKNETKELEKIKLPTTAEVEPKSKRGGAIGLLGLGLFGLLASAFGGGEEGDDRFSIGGGTRSQFKPVKIPLVGGVVNQAKKNTNIKLRTEKTFEQIREKRLEKFRKERALRNEKIKEINKKLKGKKKITKKFVTLQDKERTILKKIVKKRSPILAIESRLLNVANKAKANFIPDAPIFGSEAEQISSAIFQEIIEINKERKREGAKPLTQAERKYLNDLLKNIDPGNLKEAFGKYKAEDLAEAEKLYEKFQDSEKKARAKEVELEKEIRKERRTKFKFRGEPNFKIGKFSPKDFLSGKFKQFGTATKPARDVVKKAVSKIPLSKSTGLFLGKNLMRLGKGIDFLTAGYESFKLYQGFRKGDNILTAYYDLGVAIHNMFEPDKTKLMTYITNHQDSKLKVFKQEKNQKIRDEIQKAKEAQALSGGFNPINKASDIVPFAVQKTGQQIMLSSPAFTGYRFILDKLYKQ